MYYVLCTMHGTLQTGENLCPSLCRRQKRGNRLLSRAGLGSSALAPGWPASR